MGGGSGRAGILPAGPGILPGTTDFAEAAQRAGRAGKLRGDFAVDDRLSTSEGPGRIPGLPAAHTRPSPERADEDVSAPLATPLATRHPAFFPGL